MCEMKLMDLQLFGEGGDGGAAGDAGQGEGSAAEINIGDVLADGTVVDESLASSMREYPELYATLSREQQAHAQAPGTGQAEAVQEQAGNDAEPTREEWEEAKKKFKKFFGEDVHASVNDRFKNQAAATKQLERQQKSLFPSVAEYARFYSISEDVLKLAKPDAYLLHPGPCNHGVELPTSVYDCPQSVINEQVTNGVAVRMAVHYLLVARRNMNEKN